MARNEVVVRIRAEDQLTGAIRGLRSEIGGISGGFRSALGSAMAFGVVVAGIAGSVLSIGKLTEGLGKSLKSELSELASANSLRLSMKIDSTGAKQIIKELSNELSVKADQLPGDTDDYLAAARQFTGTIGRLGQGVKALKKDLTDLATSTVILSQESGADPGQGAMTVNRLLSGSSSFSELKRNDFFEKNAGLRTAIEQEFSTSGLSATKAGQDPLRIKEAYQRATARIITPEYLADIQKTGMSQLDTLKSLLFSERTGLFGFGRELVGLGDLGGLGGKTVRDFFKNFLGGLSEAQKAFGGYLGKSGLGFDPMLGVARLIQSFTDLLGDLKRLFDAGGDVWRNLTTLFIDGTSSVLMRLTGAIQSVDWSEMGLNFGKSIGQILTDVKLGIALEKILTDSVMALGNALDGVLKGVAEELRKSFIKPFEDKVNKRLNEYSGGILGTNPDGSDNGVQRAVKGAGDDFNKSPVGRIWNSLFNNQEAKPLPQMSPQSFNNQGGVTASMVFNVASGADLDPEMVADQVLTSLNRKYREYKDRMISA